MCLFGMYVVDMRHTEPRDIESPRVVSGGSGIVAVDDFIMFVPFPIVCAVGWRNISGCQTHVPGIS